MRTSLTLVAAACCVAPAACSTSENLSLAMGRGALGIDWAIAGETEPEACTARGARTFELLVRDELGLPVVTAEVACDEFSIAVDLPPGAYVARAELLDAAGGTVGEPVEIVDVYIEKNAAVRLAIDFD